MQIKAQAVSIAADVLNVENLKEIGVNALGGVVQGINSVSDWVSDKVGMSSEQAKIGGQ